MSRFRRLQPEEASSRAGASSGRDRRIHCIQSYVPAFTAERIRRGQSRLRVAVELCVAGFVPRGWNDEVFALEDYVFVTEQLVRRIEERGQSAGLDFVRALAIAWQIGATRAAAIVATEGSDLPSAGAVLRLQGQRHAR